MGGSVIKPVVETKNLQIRLVAYWQLMKLFLYTHSHSIVVKTCPPQCGQAR